MGGPDIRIFSTELPVKMLGSIWSNFSPGNGSGSGLRPRWLPRCNGVRRSWTPRLP
jgi:hypothetical protein